MNCRNCGAPMRLILEKRQYVCNHCTTSFFPEENQDGIRLLGAISQGNCPVCKIPPLTFATIADKTVLHCNDCRGFLLQLHELLPMIQKLRMRRPAGVAVIPVPANHAERKRKIDCPVCRKVMDTYMYGGGGNVYVDSCIDCGVLWLDYCELSRIVEAPTYPKREPYRTEWEISGVRHYTENSDLWQTPSILTSNLGAVLDRLFW